MSNEIVKYASAGGVASAVMMLPTIALAEGATTVGVSDFQGVLTAMEGQINVSNTVAVLTAGVTASIGLVFMWWGVRKLVKMLMAAFRKSRASV